MLLLKNNAYSTLGGSLTNVATTMAVATGTGNRFDAVAAPDYFYLTLQDTANNIEIVKVTARTLGSDSMTIERAQDGTTARAWNIGDVCEVRLSKAVTAPLQVMDGAATAADIRTKLGASAAGSAVFTAADAAAQRTALGGTATGSSVFTAADAAAARAAISALSTTEKAASAQVADRVLSGAAGGTADAITATFSPNVTLLTDGLVVRITGAVANGTTTPTLAAGTTAATTIKNPDGTAISIGQIGQEFQAVYSAALTAWLLQPNGRSKTQAANDNSTNNATTAYVQAELAAEFPYRTGDLMYSKRTLAAPDFLPADGSVYLQSSYAALYAQLGIMYWQPTKLSNPATLPAGIGKGCSFTPAGDYFAIAHNNSPRVSIYSVSGDTFTKLADPATLPTGDGSWCAFSPNGTYLAVTHATSPWLTVYKNIAGTWTKLANPSSLPPAATPTCVAWDPTSTYIAITNGTTAVPVVFKLVSDVLTRLADGTGTSGGQACMFTPDGNYLITCGATSPFIRIHERSGDAFTGVTQDATATVPGACYSLAQTPDGSTIFLGGVTTIYTYRRQGGTLKYIPETLDMTAVTAGHTCNALAFSRDGYLAAAFGDSGAPGVGSFRVLKWLGSTLKEDTSPRSISTGSGNGAAWNPVTAHLAEGHSVSPFVGLWSPSYDRTTSFLVPYVPDIPGGARPYFKT